VVNEIGLFPLGIVLLPTEQVPLHIFEPRYRELIGECISDDRQFGLVLADDEGMRSIGTRATVVDVVDRFPDGRMNIVVEGGSRFRLVELTRGRSFQTAEVEEVDDQHDPGDPGDAERAIELFEKLADLTGADVDVPPADSEQLSFLIAARFDFTPLLKQELLQETSERIRLTRLCELLEKAAETIARQQEIAARAQTNGRVDADLLPEPGS
jgi:Lon protease-like protein